MIYYDEPVTHCQVIRIGIFPLSGETGERNGTMSLQEAAAFKFKKERELSFMAS